MWFSNCDVLDQTRVFVVVPHEHFRSYNQVPRVSFQLRKPFKSIFTLSEVQIVGKN